MRYALHPQANRFIDVAAYTREFGKRPTGHIGPWNPTRPRCPYCPAALAPRAQSPERIAHFAHPRGSSCPSIARARTPYHGLTPLAGNREQAATLFDAFLAEWPSHYIAVRSLVPFLSEDEFEEIVGAATDANSWAWVDLPLWAVPYMLVLQRDYPPQSAARRNPNRPRRELWFRFWFNHEPLLLNALWIHPAQPPRLVRASYRLKPGQRRPTEDELTKDPVSFEIGPALIDAARIETRPPEWLIARLEPRLRAIRARLP